MQGWQDQRTIAVSGLARDLLSGGDPFVHAKFRANGSGINQESQLFPVSKRLQRPLQIRNV